jgi:hypothetical protein
MTPEQIVRRHDTLPPEWDRMNAETRVQYLRWRTDCITNQQNQNSRRPHGRHTGVQRRNDAPSNGAPRWVNEEAMTRNNNSTGRGYRPLSPEFESNRPSHIPDNYNPQYQFGRDVPSHIRIPPEYTLPPPPPTPQNIDPEWFREVSQALGPEGVAQLRKEQFRVGHAQNNPNNRRYGPPQMVHPSSAPPPPSHIPIPAPIDPGHMADFSHIAMMGVVQGRRRSTPNPR